MGSAVLLDIPSSIILVGRFDIFGTTVRQLVEDAVAIDLVAEGFDAPCFSFPDGYFAFEIEFHGGGLGVEKETFLG